MIKQCKFSDSVIFFKEKFFERWSLVDYFDNSQPAIFFGVYNSDDVNSIKNHKGRKIVFFAGADIPNLTKIIDEKNIIFASDMKPLIEIFKSQNIPHIDKSIPVKSYSEFKPFPKGNKIYVYRNNSTQGNYVKFKLDLIEPTIKHFGEDMFLFGLHGNTMQQIIDNYYKKSFINIQLNENAGFTSALEMAHMGRKSISNNPAPFCISYKTSQDIINIIEKEINNKSLDTSVNGYLYESNDWMKL